MGKAQLSILAGIATCSIGILTALVWLLFTPVKPSNPIVLAEEPATLSSITPIPVLTPTPTLKEEIDIKFEGIKELLVPQNSGRTKIARFKVTNRLQEWVYYLGYSYEDTCDYDIYKDGKKLPQNNCWSGTGLYEREMWKNDTRTLELPIPSDLEGNFQVEFSFKVGKKRRKETVRIDAELPIKQTKIK